MSKLQLLEKFASLKIFPKYLDIFWMRVSLDITIRFDVFSN